MMNQTSTSGRIFNIQKFSLHDGPGIRTLVFFQGCPLTCWWCSNPEGQAGPTIMFKSHRCHRCGRCVAMCANGGHTLTDTGHDLDRAGCITCGRCAEACLQGCLEVAGRSMRVDEIMAVVRQDQVFYDTSGGGVTLGGGDPLTQPALARAVLRQCRDEGIHTAVETAAHARLDLVQSLVPLVDYWLVDLKHVDTDVHRDGTGVDNDLILRNLRWLVAQDVPMKLRIPLIPGFNADHESLQAMATFVTTLQPGPHFDGVDLMPLHAWAGGKYTQLGRQDPFVNVQRPSSEQLSEYANVFAQAGLSVSFHGQAP